MPYMDRKNAEIYYQIEGSGPVILLSHGYGATSEMWSAQVAELCDEWTVVTWDIRGHGRTNVDDDVAAYSEEQAVADMDALLDAAGAEVAVISGLSLGGYLSLAYWWAHRDRVAGLVLCDTGPGFRSDDSRRAWNLEAESWARKFETRGLAALDDPELSREISESTTHQGAKGLVHAARGLFVQEDSHVIDSLPEIECPTLMVVGELDTRFIAPAEYMKSKIEDSELAVIENAGHAANIDSPQVFNETVSDFLQRNVVSTLAGENGE